MTELEIAGKSAKVMDAFVNFLLKNIFPKQRQDEAAQEAEKPAEIQETKSRLVLVHSRIDGVEKHQVDATEQK